ncbi:MAG: hypothetical protein ACTSPI_13370, partial [Candidatus Heimdallarchaeaceae archaeon]
MHVEENRRHKTLSIFLNSSYYLFVALVIALIIIFAFNFYTHLLVVILLGALVASSFLLLFYLTIQMFKHNFRVGKNVQFGIFIFIIGFLLILLSISKYFFSSSLLGDSFYAYWGLGAIGVGIILELT